MHHGTTCWKPVTQGILISFKKSFPYKFGPTEEGIDFIHPWTKNCQVQLHLSVTDLHQQLELSLGTGDQPVSWFSSETA